MRTSSVCLLLSVQVLHVHTVTANISNQLLVLQIQYCYYNGIIVLLYSESYAIHLSPIACVNNRRISSHSLSRSSPIKPSLQTNVSPFVIQVIGANHSIFLPLFMSTATISQATRAHGALLCANFFFGMSAIVGALGLPATHPLVFALYREVLAGALLMVLSCYFYNNNDDVDNDTIEEDPKRINRKNSNFLRGAMKSQWKSFAVLGFLVFGNQAGAIVGLQLTDPVTLSVWQPSQPIMAAAISMALGWEPVRRKRLAGVAVAFVGCVVMVLLKKHGNSATNEKGTVTNRGRYTFILGNFLFFVNCLCHSLYIMTSKRMLSLYPALFVTACSYSFAALYMIIATYLATVEYPVSNKLLCPECGDSDIWQLPQGALPALLYYVVVGSVLCYGLLTWACRTATGTLVTSYSVLQPVTATIITTLLLVIGIVPPCSSSSSSFCLDFPTWGTFCGMMGVFGGLAVIIATEPSSSKEKNTTAGEEDLETLPSDLELYDESRT